MKAVPELLLSEYLDVVTRTESMTDQHWTALVRLHRFREKIALRQKLVSQKLLSRQQVFLCKTISLS
jgi:hypothetical protein